MIKEGTFVGKRYQVVSKLGSGGMADVYKAIDRVLNRYVAVKVLKDEFREDGSFVEKFESEARTAAGLQHPNVVNVYDVASDGELYYIVMELVEGITLKEYIQKKGHLSPKEVIGITLQVCAGIDAAHSNQIIHRDIKPQNIIISKEGQVKVTDFGIAKATSSNTISTNAMGSVHYTSPEQARGGFSDAKSDIYSLGITMYEMVTGELPFDGDSTVSIALKHLQEDIVPPSEHLKVPYGLEQIIMKCTQKSADRRYVNMAQLIRDLKRALQDPEGDFVKISPLLNGSPTKSITKEELEQIKDNLSYSPEYDDEYDDEYDSDERERRRAAKKKGGVDPRMARIMRIMTIVAASVFVLVLVLIIGNVAGLFKSGQGVTQQEDKNVVPKLVGLTLEEAQEACTEAGLVLVIDREQESPEYDKGYIFYQKTGHGVKVPEGTKIQVYLSTGLKLVPIPLPDIAGKTEKEAIIDLVNAGFAKKNITVKTEEHATIEEGYATRTDPAVGESATKDAKITLYLSNGYTKVPGVVGKSREEAEKLLTDAGLKVNVTIDKNSDAAENEVISQDYDEGEKLEQGETVDITVSAGAKKAEIPSSLIGKHYMDAITALEDLGFTKITTEGTNSTKYGREMVVFIENKQGDKISGTKVSLDTEIIIYINELMTEDDSSENQ